MYLQNLTVFQFLALFLPLVAAIVALYLYDRSRRRQTVSTLRFFQFVSQSAVFVRRKKIRHPWSLLLQLAALAFLALAIAKLRWDHSALMPQDHVLLLETSSWMNSLDLATGEQFMQEAKREALRYLAALPESDRVILIRVDALATPVTPLTSNRDLMARAIRASTAGSTSLNLSAALELAQSTQQSLSSSPGEIVFVGSGRVTQSEWQHLDKKRYSNLSAIWIGRETDNIGIRKLSARRLPAEPALWEIDLGLYNYSARERQVSLGLTFENRPVASRRVLLAPHAAGETRYRLRTHVHGQLEAAIYDEDAYRQDNRAVIELPTLETLRIQVFTPHPALWKPLFEGRPYLDPEFHKPGEYTSDGPSNRLVILDGFTPSVQPDADTVSILPQPPESETGHAMRAAPTRWNVSHPIAQGVHDRDLVGARGTALEVSDGDIVVAEWTSGPVLVASGEGAFKKVRLGFNPLDRRIRNLPAIPLLFANILGWISPGLLMPTEINAASPGLVELETAPGVRREQIRLTSSSERDLPFTLNDSTLSFYSGKLGAVRVEMPGREVMYRINLPEVGEALWSSAPVSSGSSPPARHSGVTGDLWPLLALAGTLMLWLEWVFYGRAPAAISDGPKPAVAVTSGPSLTQTGQSRGEARL